MEKYRKAVEENICSICVDSDEIGDCTLTRNELCAVKYFLPKILDIVHNNDFEDMSEYVDSIRENVCAECLAENHGNGYCYLREDANCSLDRYFSIIVETIKRVDEATAT